MAATEAQKRANKRYYEKNKGRFRSIMLRFDKQDDADVLAVLDDVPNRVEYVRQLVRSAIRSGK